LTFDECENLAPQLGGEIVVSCSNAQTTNNKRIEGDII
jgi:hypothetical protein